MKSKVTPFRLWVTFFALWAIFLSGVLAGFVGTPGAIQAIHLKSLLNEKQARLAEIQAGIDHLQSEASELERSKVVQRREIRRVLGYAAGDELIFDFNSPDSI